LYQKRCIDNYKSAKVQIKNEKEEIEKNSNSMLKETFQPLFEKKDYLAKKNMMK